MRQHTTGDERSLRRRPGTPADQLTIGQLAHLTGVSAKAIRYYESVGLLPPPPRGANRYRRYGVADVNRLCLLRRIRLLNVPLSVAKPLLIGSTDARCAEVQRELLSLVGLRLRTIDQEIAELHQLRAALEMYRRALADCDADAEMSFSACTDMSCIAPPGDLEHELEHEGETYGSECRSRAV